MIKKLVAELFCLLTLALPLTTSSMEQKKFLDENEKPDNKKIENKKNEKKSKEKKKHARILKLIKTEKQKEEFDAIWAVFKKLEKNFNEYEKNNVPYDDLVKKFYNLLSQNQQKNGSIPFDPEKLLTVGLTYTGLPDFIVHAIMAYVGFKYTKLITSSSTINDHLTNGINTNQRFSIPWPKKKFQLLVPDNVEGKPIFSPDGSLLAITGSKYITVFNTITGKKIGQCKKLFNGIQLVRFYMDNPHKNTTSIFVKTEEGPTLYELTDECNSSDGIPNISLLKNDEELKNEHKEFETKLKETKKITTLSSTTISGSALKKKQPHTPRKNIPKNTVVYTSLPEELSVGSFLPPYTNRFGVTNSKLNACLAFIDFDLNKLFPPEKNDEPTPDKYEKVLEKQKETYKPFGLVSDNRLYGLISTTKKTVDLYGFIDMLTPKEWLFVFCLRYGIYKKPLTPSGSWCSSVYHSFNEKERNYLDKTYSFFKPKKKNWSGSIPTLDLAKVLKNKAELDTHPHTDRKK